MTLKATTVEDRLCKLLKEYDGDQCSLELLLFLGRHPNARFSRLALAHALGGWRLEIERALRNLKDKGLVMSYAENGTAYISLTGDESMRTLVLDLLKMSVGAWQAKLRQTHASAHA